VLEKCILNEEMNLVPFDKPYLVTVKLYFHLSAFFNAVSSLNVFKQVLKWKRYLILKESLSVFIATHGATELCFHTLHLP
jgi:hypothetical protein